MIGLYQRVDVHCIAKNLSKLSQDLVLNELGPVKEIKDVRQLTNRIAVHNNNIFTKSFQFTGF